MRASGPLACLLLAGCAAVDVAEDPRGERPATLVAHPPRAVLLPARTDPDGRATATRLAWIPDTRSPVALGLVPGAGRARIAFSLREQDDLVGYLTRWEAEADARGPASVEAAGRLAAAAWTGVLVGASAGD